MDAATSSDLTSLSAQALSQQITARRLSPVDVVDAYLKRIETKEPKLQAFVEVYGNDAKLAAEAAHKAIRSGHAVGPLHGVPIALKDLIDIEGKVCTGGCGAWRSRVATHTATLARHLIAQGMIVLGKTHTVQFAMGGWGTNTQFGTPWNPWDPTRKRTPGGSSSGSGVAVAAATRAVGDRQRHRRLGAAARVMVRPDRAQDHRRTDQHVRRAAALDDARHARADVPLGRGRGPALFRNAEP